MLDLEDSCEESETIPTLSLRSEPVLPRTEVEQDTRRTPDQRLLVAMIRRAINDLGKETTREHAHEWLFESPEGAVLSFDICCEYLDWEPEDVRKSIRLQFDYFCRNRFCV